MNDQTQRRVQDVEDSNITDAFSRIPVGEILKIASATRGKLGINAAFVAEKAPADFVTEADYAIQELLLAFFGQSSLAGSYLIKSEERLASDQEMFRTNDLRWQLIIDPLDGTNAFCRGSDEWGVMAGLCSLTGQLKYSWNMVSNGAVFSSMSSSPPVVDWTTKRRTGVKLRLDIFDYNAGGIESFAEELDKSEDIWSADDFEFVGYDSAVWAGWNLYQGKVDGLLWLPSLKGKKCYPDYDLVFLGALRAQGWKVRLGRIEEDVHMVACAPRVDELSSLWNAGLAVVPPDRSRRITVDADLRITGAFCCGKE